MDRLEYKYYGSVGNKKACQICSELNPLRAKRLLGKKSLEFMEVTCNDCGNKWNKLCEYNNNKNACEQRKKAYTNAYKANWQLYLAP